MSVSPSLKLATFIFGTDFSMILSSYVVVLQFRGVAFSKQRLLYQIGALQWLSERNGRSRAKVSNKTSEDETLPLARRRSLSELRYWQRVISKAEGRSRFLQARSCRACVASLDKLDFV